MNKKKKTIIIIIGICLLAILSYFFVGVRDYLDFISVTSAEGGCPAQDGGQIEKVMMVCILDTPETDPINCAQSCPLVTSELESACVDYMELDLSSQQGTIYLAVPQGFEFKGGGQIPEAGMDYLYCGASNIMPWLIGIPSSAAMRVKKIIDFFDFAVAGFKSK